MNPVSDAPAAPAAPALPPADAAAAAADGFEELDEGTYSIVRYNPTTGIVDKSMFLWGCLKSRTLSTSLIKELAVYNSFENILPPTHPHLTVIEPEDALCCHQTPPLTLIQLRMPYYGRTLYSYLKRLPRDRRLAEYPAIFRQVVVAAHRLWIMGMQHTDLKPANITIDDAGVCRLIDYNLVSFRKGCGSDWTPSYGTWCYAAPETIAEDRITDTSIVWTLGILLAYIAAGFPIKEYSCATSDQLNSREYWKDTYEAAAAAAAPAPAAAFLPNRKMDALSPEYQEIYRQCVQWDPANRITMPELFMLQAVSSSGAVLEPPKWLRTVEYAEVVLMRDLELLRERRRCLVEIYDYCKKTRLYHCFFPAVLYLDRAAFAAGSRAAFAAGSRPGFTVGSRAAAFAAAPAAAPRGRLAHAATAALTLAMAVYASEYEPPSFETDEESHQNSILAWEFGAALRWNLIVPARLLKTSADEMRQVYHFFLTNRKNKYRWLDAI